MTSRTYGSYVLTGDHYFNKGKKEGSVLLIGGAGAGIFTQNDNSTTFSGGFDNLKTTSSSSQSSNFGALVRAGIESGHFRTVLEYDYTGGTENYYCVEIGFFFEGGKK